MKTQARLFAVVLSGLFALTIGTPAKAELRSSVSQWGVTWTFDKPYETGQFVNGDWWVLGPATIVNVDPAPGEAPDGETINTDPNQFGDVALQDDRTMRNGSMVIDRWGSFQGYDSRVKNYDASLTVRFPHTLAVNRSLISTVSLLSTVDNPNFVQGHFEDSWSVLKTAAVLTCLDAAPPSDAFRPPYSGTEKPIYRAGDLRRDLLPKLPAVANTPDWDLFGRYFERVWIDHSYSWLHSRVCPLENMPGYGREYARLTSMGSLMLCLDVPDAQKEKLLIGFVQLGIDLHGMRKNGGSWYGGGGGYNGRKWPVVFAALLFGDDAMLPDVKSTTSVFSEDQQTYFGQGWHGETALFQMIDHHGPVPPYEEKDPSTWSDIDKRSESYRKCCTSNAFIGTALAARLLRAMEAWSHDAFFAYCDRWMADDDQVGALSGGVAWDPFVTNMWKAHRAQAPAQKGAPANYKWVHDGGGQWVLNPNPDASDDDVDSVPPAPPQNLRVVADS